MLGDSPTSVGIGFQSTYPRDRGQTLQGRLRALLQPADIIFGNLETVISSNSVHHGRLARDQMRADPAILRALSGTFDIVSVANNHADQHGARAFQDTVASLRGAGIRCCGVAGAAPWHSEPEIVKVRDRRVGFLGYSLRPRQYGVRESTYATGTPESIRADVDRLRDRVDFTVVSLHWGEEFVATPSTSEQAFAQTLLESGANVVLGHHPHVTRPVEQRVGGVIAYSLGNFVSDMIWQPQLTRCMILTIQLGNSSLVRSIEFADIQDDFLPDLVLSSPIPAADDAEPGMALLSDEDYAKAASTALKKQRLAQYKYFFSNFARYPVAVSVGLISATIRNRLRALTLGHSR